ncbi:hypothetical protein HanRHA438_Chr10g0436281 [Helianthus annuus]|nr:hypothetical protein HanRHA438_Chr10g0436281 [Helianthus annuus]
MQASCRLQGLRNVQPNLCEKERKKCYLERMGREKGRSLPGYNNGTTVVGLVNVPSQRAG